MNAPVSLLETKVCCEQDTNTLSFQNTRLIHWTHFSHTVKIMLPEESVFVPEKSMLLPEESVFIPEKSVFFPEERVFVPEESVFFKKESVWPFWATVVYAIQQATLERML